MEIQVCSLNRDPINHEPIEFVERKGIGHPDTLSDAIAEAISVAYSQYCLETFHVVPNHWVDKCMLVGGECERDFGYGRILQPITLIVVGKVTHAIGDALIPFEKICRESAFNHLKSVFDLIEPEDLVVHFYTNSAVGAGRKKTWYRPNSVDDLLSAPKRKANDAVICTGYAPYSQTEEIVLKLEHYLNSRDFKANHPEIGTDIKIIGNRIGCDLTLTLCIPFIASRTPSRAYYDQKKEELIEIIDQFVVQNSPFRDVAIHINTRDDESTIYMTHLGSAIDTGDVGVVGRGNRINGLISPCREMSIEAPCGKNPIYHTGKLYAILAQEIANRIYQETGLENYVNITSQTGSDLSLPHFVGVKVIGEGQHLENLINQIVHEECRHIEMIQSNILQQTFTMY